MLVISRVRSVGQRTEIDVWATNAARLVESVWCRREPCGTGLGAADAEVVTREVDQTALVLPT